MKRAVLVGALGSILAVASVASAAISDPVKIEAGQLSGASTATPSVRVFKGIPFAAPPTVRTGGAPRSRPQSGTACVQANAFGAPCTAGGGGRGGGRGGRGGAPGTPGAAAAPGAVPGAPGAAGRWSRRTAAGAPGAPAAAPTRPLSPQAPPRRSSLPNRREARTACMRTSGRAPTAHPIGVP